MPFNPSHVFLLLKPPPTYKTSLSNNSGIEIFFDITIPQDFGINLSQLLWLKLFSQLSYEM